MTAWQTDLTRSLSLAFFLGLYVMPAALNHWILSNNAQAREFNAALLLSPGYDGVRHADPALIFFLSCTADIEPAIGPSTSLLRPSMATFKAPIEGRLLAADWDQHRGEFAGGAPKGLLFEWARTNKCENYSAIPDDALTGVILSGDPAASLSSIDDSDALRRAKLHDICRSGRVFVLDNSAGSSPALVTISGEAGAIVVHTASAYIRGQGSANVGIEGLGTSPWTLTPDYQRAYHWGETTETTQRMLIEAEPGAAVYWILNQFEEGKEFPTSVIPTFGTPTSRAQDSIYWAQLNEFNERLLPNTEGMILIDCSWTDDLSIAKATGGYSWILFQHDDPELAPTNRVIRITHHLTVPAELVAAYWRVDDSQAEASISLADIQANHQITIAIRWKQSESQMELGYYYSGAWTWVQMADFDRWTRFSPFIYLGSLFGGRAGHIRRYRLWTIDRGRSWLEDHA